MYQQCIATGTYCMSTQMQSGQAPCTIDIGTSQTTRWLNYNRAQLCCERRYERQEHIGISRFEDRGRLRVLDLRSVQGLLVPVHPERWIRMVDQPLPAGRRSLPVYGSAAAGLRSPAREGISFSRGLRRVGDWLIACAWNISQSCQRLRVLIYVVVAVLV